MATSTAGSVQGTPQAPRASVAARLDRVLADRLGRRRMRGPSTPTSTQSTTSTGLNLETASNDVAR